ncbi:MAG: UDP-N-acetylmuramoyl-L-alanyl-D-glutamate--2,6-diaminopimelate ligase [Nitrospiraceae bacterium]|nr:UDP-N-acetylmuramoyl-L-alanyl-D-glutamate--2,6-diaminopimelate ligase [Nitrospiraceae bacterium]
MPLKLSEIAERLPDARLIGPDTEIVGITHDSRQVKPDYLFAAARGSLQNGIQFAADAVDRGASAVMIAAKYADSPLVPRHVPRLVVPSVRQALGLASSMVFGYPSRRLNLVGITGTNGKTTTSFLLDAALTEVGVRTGIIGTIEFRSASKRGPSTFTTPEAPDLQAMLAEMADAGVQTVTMEVSSHGLDQRRVDSAHFRVGIFTNLSAEHLDYHGTIEQYYYAKAQLFDSSRCDFAIVSVDDEWGRRLASQLSVAHVTYGTNPDADYVVENVRVTHDGTHFTLAHDGESIAMSTRIVGPANALNAAAAYIAALELGADPDGARRGIAGCDSVAGRFQLVEAGQPSMVVVDYAHTPDAIASLISTVRSLLGKDGRVIVVGGARGGRDRLKRPALGRALATADLAVLTTDNPGDEDPHDIIAQLLLGTLDTPGRHVHIEPDRQEAICFAMKKAGPEDGVVIVGRGHETSIRVGKQLLHLDDREAVAQAAERLFSDSVVVNG